MSYEQFLQAKARVVEDCGFGVDQTAISPALFPFQQDIVRWALRRGRAAIFADTGLGKTRMQLEWARHVHEHTGKPVLILAPLAVSSQTAAEGTSIGIHVTVCQTQSDATDGINITNYERLGGFDPDEFGAVVLDESSILKNFTGKTRNALIESFAKTPFRLCCTATPAPNDYTELGNHAEFLSVMSRVEMLSMFFVHDGGSTQDWRLKGHAVGKFWDWLCRWGVVIRSPSDIGYDGSAFVLPKLTITDDVVGDIKPSGMLFHDAAGMDLQARRRARKDSLDERVLRTAEMVNGSDDPWIVWCHLNAESSALAASIPDAVEVHGSMSPESKAEAMLAFAAGEIRVLVTKPSIAGFGMNWQHCARMAFCGMSDSFEEFYQAVRRCWRFGQTREVECHIVVSEAETVIVDNVRSKESRAERMAEEVAALTRTGTMRAIKGSSLTRNDYERDVAEGDGWTLHLGDSVEVVGEMESDSIGYSVFSPPFASLYTYSASDRDMGNCADAEEFARHFQFLIRELLRVTKPGRLCSFHCMNLPTSKARDGFIGISDFRGQLIRAFQDEGWIYHSEVVIWKDPVTAMQRTKALGLLHKQIKKDSTMSRQGIPDYVVTMRKPGENPDRVTNTNETFPVDDWQQYASPVWMDINPSDTLQGTSAREDEDERHICPLQLEVIRRCLRLWTREGDLVLSPFAGIGSEGFEAVRNERRFVGVELKRSYWEQAVRNLERAAIESRQGRLFA
ncbi:MAG: helicase [Planctomycetes bacterium]|nr:helicase [Planctomycetota bacterium]